MLTRLPPILLSPNCLQYTLAVLDLDLTFLYYSNGVHHFFKQAFDNASVELDMLLDELQGFDSYNVATLG